MTVLLARIATLLVAFVVGVLFLNPTGGAFAHGSGHHGGSSSGGNGPGGLGKVHGPGSSHNPIVTVVRDHRQAPEVRDHRPHHHLVCSHGWCGRDVQAVRDHRH